MNIVDSHHHFWALARGDYDWLTPDLPALHRDFLPGNLAPLLARHGITSTIVIQAAPTEAETLFLLELARRSDVVKGVVGWADLWAPDATDRIEHLKHAGGKWLKGLRPTAAEWARLECLAEPGLDSVCEKLVSCDLSLDVLIEPPERASGLFDAIRERLQRTPCLELIIDHAGYPDPDGMKKWRSAMRSLASGTKAYCKLSGLTALCPAGSVENHVHAVAATVFETFGARRVMWGSDWPVVNLASSYDAWIALCQDVASQLTPEERVCLFAETARRCYRLDSAGSLQ